MKTVDNCTEFLKWALPRAAYKWRGFKKVKGQVCKRVKARIDELSLSSLDDYKEYLNKHNNEWQVFDSFCYITISRFYRNKIIFEKLEEEIFPRLIEILDKNENVIKCWSVGCASGEEPYSVNIAWNNFVNKSNIKKIELKIVATDGDETVLTRARKGEYQASSMKNVPDELIEKAFRKRNDRYNIKDKYKSNINFILQNIKNNFPNEKFHIIFCRNLILTYFDEERQKEYIDKILTKLVTNGYLIIGSNESLPERRNDLSSYHDCKAIFVKK